MRANQRQPNELRPIRITPHFLSHADGSCLIEVGKTRVICSAMLEESVPPFLKGGSKGWLTAEYSMLPACSSKRIQRERTKLGGRTQEIQRLIGRSLRSCVDLKQLGERSILMDCDVVDADGGTRTASITGAYVALVLGTRVWGKKLAINWEKFFLHAVAAVSVGIINKNVLLDLDYEEDKKACVDMNIVRTSTGKFIEVQGTAEGEPFDDTDLQSLLKSAAVGIENLFQAQKVALDLG